MSTDPRPVTLGHWLRPALRRQRGALLLAGLSLAGVLAAELLAPWPLKLVVDHVLLGHPLPAGLAALEPWIAMGATAALWAAAAAMTVLAVVTGACAYAETYLCARVGQVLAHDLRTALFAHLARLPLSFHLTNHSSELIARVGADTLLLRDAFGDWLVKAVSQVLLVAGVLGVMAMMDWRLAAGVALVMPLLFFLLRRLARRLRDVARLQRRQDARVAARLGETLPAMALVQAYGREDEVVRAFTAESAAAATAGTDNARVAGAMSRVVAVVGALCAAATVLGGGHLVLSGVLSPGGLLVFVAYVAALFKPLRDLGKLAAKFARARVAAERLAELAAATPEAPDAPDAHALVAVRGALALHDVTFAYPDGRCVLRAASLAIQPGEHVAIIGASGAGKSTLLRLLLRLEEPQSGHLSLDGHPIGDCTRASVRAAIGVSLQEAVMTGSSVRENIAFGCSGASDAQVRAAALQAGADEFISALPEGYDTPVGERGARLSGGQRQRLCLARALVRDPPVLVLDEPTAALDPASALALEQTLHAARRGRTTLFISHQFGALAAFDRVIEVRDGGLHDVTAECRAAAGIPLRQRKLG